MTWPAALVALAVLAAVSVVVYRYAAQVAELGRRMLVPRNFNRGVGLLHSTLAVVVLLTGFRPSMELVAAVEAMLGAGAMYLGGLFTEYPRGGAATEAVVEG